MFCLHVSNRTENLLHHLTEIIRVDKQTNLFASELFLIQSQGMERMIAQTLADEFRSFCNFRFFLPLDFLGFVADTLDMGITPDGFQRQILTWRLDGLLRDLSDDVYEPLRYYLSGQNGELKRFQLARRLANIFDQYQVMRSDILNNWESGKLATSHAAENWQMDLWQRLLAQPGGDVHRGMLFRQVIERLSGTEDFSALLPKRISVIGLHTMPPLFLDYLNGLAHHMDVHLFLLSPCRSYWGNVETKRAQFKRNLRNSTQVPELAQDEHHPLLAVLGRQGRDLQNMMLDVADFALELTSYYDPLEEAATASTLLQCVQSDLLRGTLPEKPVATSFTGDNSIQIVSCHSKLREIQVLKDHLLDLLHKNPELELRDIVVMAPDIQEYSALIPAVFADVQHSIADRSTRRRNSVIAAFLSFLDLFKGRFGWSEVIDLFKNQMIFSQYKLSPSDIDTLQQWVVDVGIRWGLSGHQRQNDGLPEFEEGSWRAGLDRLLMGYAIESEGFVDGLLPFNDIEGKGALPLGILCQFVEVIDQAYKDFQQSRTVADWSEKLLFSVDQLFGDTLEQELVELRVMIAELGESISQFHSDNVGFEVIREWFTQSAKESRSSTGFLRGQLTFCSMLPMRSIPFSVVCLMGLNDGAFPKNDTHDTFDLMGTDFRAGDRSPRADDRYQFLEAILAARSYLYLSYVGQSIRTNEEISPSVVVTEFIEVLEEAYGVQALSARHPLHPFSRKYFENDGDPKLFSYNHYYCDTATKLLQGAQKPEPWWQGRLIEEPAVISPLDLLRFYLNPQKYFVQNCLGVRLDAGDDLPCDSEMFELSGLDKYHVEQKIVRSAFSGDMSDCLKAIQIEGRWPLGTSGNIAFDQKKEAVEQFVCLVRAQGMGEAREDVHIDCIIGGHRLVGQLSNIYENGGMLQRYGKLRGRDLMTGWVHHLLHSTVDSAVQTKIVASDALICFEHVADGGELSRLIDLFVEGCRAPSQFFVDPAFAYAEQARKNGKKSPLDAANDTFIRRLDAGYESEWELLFQGASTILDVAPDFESLSLEIMCPILEAANDQ